MQLATQPFWGILVAFCDVVQPQHDTEVRQHHPYVRLTELMQVLKDDKINI